MSLGPQGLAQNWGSVQLELGLSIVGAFVSFPLGQSSSTVNSPFSAHNVRDSGVLSFAAPLSFRLIAQIPSV